MSTERPTTGFPGRDIIGLVETGYAPAESDAQWLCEVTDAARPFLDAGLGVLGFFFDREEKDGARCVWGAKCYGADPRFAELESALYAGMPRPTRAMLFSGSEPIATGSALHTRGAPLDTSGPPYLRETARTLGFRDSLGVAVCDASRLGAILGAPSPVLRRIEVATRQRWARVTGHLAAGLRLHRVATGLRGSRNHRSHRRWSPISTGHAGPTPARRRPTVLVSVEGKLATLVACGDP